MANPGIPTEPRRPTIKRLFALCSNRCAFDDCVAEIIKEEIVLGEVCHIEGAKIGSARYNPTQTPEDRHGYDNLILLCGSHHTEIDADEASYSVDRLREMKQTHEARHSSISDSSAESAAILIVSQGQNGGVTAHTINVDTLNVFASASMTPSNDSPASERALGDLSPEIGRILRRQIAMLDRASAQFSCASGDAARPTEIPNTFRPFKPTQYPHDPACREISDADVVLLAEFYGGVQEIDDHVSMLQGDAGSWDMNTVNGLMQMIGRNVEVGMRAVERFCPSRLCDPGVPTVGTLLERGTRSLETMRMILAVHIERYTVRQDARKAAKEGIRKGVNVGDFASELARLAGSNRLAWFETARAAAHFASLSLEAPEPCYKHQLHGLTHDEIVLYWLTLARLKKLRLDLTSAHVPIALPL